jgi:hypothetical protein
MCSPIPIFINIPQTNSGVIAGYEDNPHSHQIQFLSIFVSTNSGVIAGFEYNLHYPQSQSLSKFDKINSGVIEDC